MGRSAGKVAVVTGASNGIGSGIAKAFAAAGARVAVNYSSDRNGAERIVQRDHARWRRSDCRWCRRVKHRGRGAPIYSRRCGVRTSRRSRQQRRHLPLWCFRGYHGRGLPRALQHQRARIDCDRAGAVKRFGPDGGSIIKMSSIVASRPNAGVVLCASTKGAMETLTKGLALEIAPRKIRVNAIAPGRTETEGTATAGIFEGAGRLRPGGKDTPRPAGTRHGYRGAGGVSGIRRIGVDHRRDCSRSRRSRRRGLIPNSCNPIRTGAT
jgi:3-oxoacyl-[acyl-carrier protein] reductase